MLVVDSIVPGSHAGKDEHLLTLMRLGTAHLLLKSQPRSFHAEHLLEPGDVVTRVEGRVVTHFLTLEDILDSAVGKSVALDLERGGQPVHATVQVQLLSSGIKFCKQATATKRHMVFQSNGHG